MTLRNSSKRAAQVFDKQVVLFGFAGVVIDEVLHAGPYQGVAVLDVMLDER